MKLFGLKEIFHFHDLELIKRPHLTMIAIFSIIFLFLYTFINYENSITVTGIIHLLSGTSVFLFIYLMYKNKKSYWISLYSLTLLFAINLLIVFAENLDSPFQAVWLPVIAFIFLYILGFQKGLFVTITVSTLLVMIFFIEHEKSSLIPPSTIYNAVLSYLFVGIITGIHSRHIENQDKLLLTKCNYDYLTGIFNRRAFLNYLLKEFEFIKRNKNSSLSIILLDIDNFKSINNSYGHETGDHVLLMFKDIILDHLRTTDIFARWGGEQFIIAAIDTNKQNAKLLGDKMRKLIEEHTFEGVEKLTASIGISGYSEGDHLDSIIKKADQALQNAKKSGKNQVAVFE